jgi:2-phospho-L-lactate guanylyltransferase
MSYPQYAALVPVKPPARGKSRLVGPGDEVRRALAAAFARDTVAACLAAERVAQVLVVTDDVRFAGELTALGCAAIPDGVTGDLNGTLREAAAEARRRWPVLAGVAICADLPSLLPADLDDALARVPAGVGAFVADAAGVGTTLYTAPYDAFDPRFGPGSREAHLDAGAVALGGELATLRRDVDDLTDLDAARVLGLGRHTAAVAAALPAR